MQQRIGAGIVARREVLVATVRPQPAQQVTRLDGVVRGAGHGSVLVGDERRTEPGPGAMESDRGRRLGNAERRRQVGTAQTVPVGEQQHLPVRRRQPVECVAERFQRAGRDRVRFGLGALCDHVGDFVEVFAASSTPPHLVAGTVAGDRDQPPPCGVGGNVIESSPRNLEGARHDGFGVGRTVTRRHEVLD